MSDLLDILSLILQRVDQRAERRILFSANVSSTTALVLAGTCPNRSLPAIRSFLERHLSFTYFFGASLGVTFNFEFHIPFYALRRGPPCLDHRSIGTERLRNYARLPLGGRDIDETLDFYYEAQLSLLVTGVDEWF